MNPDRCSTRLSPSTANEVAPMLEAEFLPSVLRWSCLFILLLLWVGDCEELLGTAITSGNSIGGLGLGLRPVNELPMVSVIGH